MSNVSVMSAHRLLSILPSPGQSRRCMPPIDGSCRGFLGSCFWTHSLFVVFSACSAQSGNRAAFSTGDSLSPVHCLLLSDAVSAYSSIFARYCSRGCLSKRRPHPRRRSTIPPVPHPTPRESSDPRKAGSRYCPVLSSDPPVLRKSYSLCSVTTCNRLCVLLIE